MEGTNQVESIRKIIAVLETVSDLDRDMQMQTLLAFLHVAEANLMGHSANVSLVKEKVGVTSAAATRSVQAWSDSNRYSKKGHECLDRQINPANRTEKILTLTPKGKEVIEALHSAVTSN